MPSPISYWTVWPRCFTDGYPAAVQPAREAVRAYTRADRTQDQDDFRWLWLAGLLAVDLWEDESWDLLTARYLRIVRELGDLTELLLVLHHRVVFCLFAGEIPTAISLDVEIQTINEATGAGLAPHGGVVLAAWRGHEDDAVALIANAIDESEARGEGGGMTTAHFANAVLFNGLGEVPGRARVGSGRDRVSLRAGHRQLVAPRAGRGGHSRAAGQTSRPRPSNG